MTLTILSALGGVLALIAYNYGLHRGAAVANAVVGNAAGAPSLEEERLPGGRVAVAEALD